LPLRLASIAVLLATPAAFLADPDASVRIAAAGAALRSGPAAAAFRVIANSLSPPSLERASAQRPEHHHPGEISRRGVCPQRTSAAKSNAEYLMRTAESLLSTSK
jgi:hypothetical protein